MNEDSNVAVLREAYQLWSDNKERAFEHWMGLMADDVKLESIADGAAGLEFSRCCSCKDDVLRYFLELAETWEMLDFRVDEFVAQGDRVVALGRCSWRNRNTGRILETPKADIIRMRDSKIVEFYEFYDTAKAIAAAQP